MPFESAIGADNFEPKRGRLDWSGFLIRWFLPPDPEYILISVAIFVISPLSLGVTHTLVQFPLLCSIIQLSRPGVSINPRLSVLFSGRRDKICMAIKSVTRRLFFSPSLNLSKILGHFVVVFVFGALFTRDFLVSFPIFPPSLVQHFRRGKRSVVCNAPKKRSLWFQVKTYKNYNF